jgi:hypothetical protein
MRQPIDLPSPPRPDPIHDPIALAVAAEVVERGDEASVLGLLAREGVTEQEFTARFASLEDCAVDAYERFIADFERRIGTAFNAGTDWRISLRAAAYEAADWMTENPQLVPFGMTGVLGMKSEIARVRREELFVFCGNMIDLGRNEPGAEVGEDKAAAMFAIGSILQLLTHRLQQKDDIDPHRIVPELMYTVVRTYLGEEIAREELTLPAPDPRDRA